MSTTPTTHKRKSAPKRRAAAAHKDVRDDAFALDTRDGGDDLGQTFVENVTGADDAASEHREEALTEEAGGPFVITSAETEFADDTDESNPADAKREPLPTTSHRGS